MLVKLVRECVKYKVFQQKDEVTDKLYCDLFTPESRVQCPYLSKERIMVLVGERIRSKYVCLMK